MMSSNHKLSRPAQVLRGYWKQLPASWRRAVWKLVGPHWQLAYARRQLARPSITRSCLSDAPLVVAGLFSTANGIGEAARATYRSLDAAGLSPIAVDLSQHLAPVDLDCPFPCQPMPPDETGTLILQLNGPETMAALQHLGMRRGRNWYTIGYWAWELPTFPKNWHSAFRFLSEVWAISEYTAQALRTHNNAPEIFAIPHAVAPPQHQNQGHNDRRWPDDHFVFLTMADGMSSFSRKNPFAAIRAFKEAFSDAQDRRLIVKTRNLDHKPEARADLLAAIGDAENIEILDASLSELDLWALLKSVDCFVSLHRSEGFGLVLAEAMALGKPVISTGWSGNMDFTNDEVAALVEYELVPCVDPYGIYADTASHWAEVDLDDAVMKMKKIVEDTGYRDQISSAAKQHIRVWASPERVGAIMADRLSQTASSSAEHT